MKHKPSFRLFIAILTVVILVLMLEKKRTENRRKDTKATRKARREESNINFSTTDFIFFESLSKYRFISFEN
jgi:hypothetical protein